MRQVKTGDSVKIHYNGRLTDGSEFDSSAGNEPLSFTLGDGEVIAGFDEAVLGMVVGESKTVTIPAEQAYGPLLPDMVARVARADLPEDLELTLGAQMEVSQEDGSTFLVMITELSDDFVTLDANHPLAGKDLVFDLHLVEIVGQTTH